MPDLSRIPFVQAKWYTFVPENLPRTVQLIVIHDMETVEKGNAAENVAKYFANGSGGRKASAHYCIDNDSIVQCVQCKDVAYGAANCNRNGVHLEHAGFARQSKAEWEDEYSSKMLKLSAELCAKVLVPKFQIPVKWLSSREIIQSYRDRNVKGFCTHFDITLAWKAQDSNYSGSHTDPGISFPKVSYLEWIKDFLRT